MTSSRCENENEKQNIAPEPDGHDRGLSDSTAAGSVLAGAAKDRILGSQEGQQLHRRRGVSFPAAFQARGSFPAASQEEGRELPSSFPRGRARGWQEPQKPRSLVGTKKYNILNKRNKEKAYFRRVKPNLEFGDPTRSRRDHARDHPGPNILPAS